MRQELRDWWVTVLVDRQRTKDEVIRAPSAYAAGWLWRYLYPGSEVAMVRQVQRDQPKPVPHHTTARSCGEATGTTPPLE